MTIMPMNPVDRDFMIESFVEEHSAGRTTVSDGDDILAQLRLVGDLGRLERLARILRGAAA